MTEFDLLPILPTVSLSAFALLALVLVPFFRGSSRPIVLVALSGLGVTVGVLWSLWQACAREGAIESAAGLVRVDPFGLYISFLLLLIGILTVFYSVAFLEREEADIGEFYPLLLFCLAGMMIMVHTTHLMMVLIGLEIFSLSLYVITGLTRMRPRSVEAALKYFLLGAFSSGFMVYGLALLYGTAGSLEMIRIASIAAAGPGRLFWIGVGLFLIGLAFKIGAVPFHQWVPDVYEGAPTNVTGFMAAATKTAVFVVLIRFLVGALGRHEEIWIPLITWLSILTMTVGNLIALAQTNLKRMLAFSSIAHAGYLLIAIVCRPDEGVGAIVFYLTVYGLMTVGAFAVLSAVGRGDVDGERGYELSDWAGLGWRRPVLGMALTFFLFSLAGLPPTGGFLGKYVIFAAAVHSDRWLLAVVGMLNATVAVYYYLRVVVSIYMREPERDELPLPVTPGAAAVMLVSVAGVVWLGLAPGRLLDVARTLAASIL